jgi:hypothetical protein
MDDQKEWESLVKEIDQGARLTDWEESFIDDMLKMMGRQERFTSKQGAVIERIYKQRLG